MSFTHTHSASVSEPHTCNSNVNEFHTHSVTVSKPHSSKSSSSEPHTRNLNVNELHTHSLTVSEAVMFNLDPPIICSPPELIYLKKSVFFQVN